MSHLLFAAQPTTPLESAVGVYLMLVFLLSLSGWAWAGWQFYSTGELLRFEPHSPVPWNVLSVLVMLCLWIASMLAGQLLAAKIGGFKIVGNGFEQLDVRQKMLMLSLPAVSHWMAMGVFVIWVRSYTQATWADLGVQLRRIGSDLRLGVAAFVILVPPVLLLQTLLTGLFPEQQHPLITALQENANTELVLAICFTAVISAPVLEELMYRLVIQGWLERVFGIRRETKEAKADSLAPDDTNADDTNADDQFRSAWMAPILLTSLLFAGAHYGHGPAPISLFFLALGLGYLYQRTHRLLPCIVVHGLLNTQTTVLLLIGLQNGDPAAVIN